MASSAPDAPTPLVERIARRQRLVVALLALVTLAGWAWLATRPMVMSPALPGTVQGPTGTGAKIRIVR